MTVVIFGDVHGEADKLRRLVDEARDKWEEVSFLSVGDFIDRGPKSKEVIQICVDEGIEGILGNHELWFHKLLHKREFDDGCLHPVMGGRATLKSYGLDTFKPEEQIDERVPESHRDFILGLPLYRSVEVAGVTYWLLHAGFSESLGNAVHEDLKVRAAEHGIPVTDDLLVEVFAQAVPDEILWNHFNVKAPQIFKLPDGGVQVMGHTPCNEPIDGGHFLALDTGCGRKQSVPLGVRGKARKKFIKPNALSAVVLHEGGAREFISVKDDG